MMATKYNLNLFVNSKPKQKRTTLGNSFKKKKTQNRFLIYLVQNLKKTLKTSRKKRFHFGSQLQKNKSGMFLEKHILETTLKKKHN